MDNETKLNLALLQINNVMSLMKGNEWQTYLYHHLETIECELKRQLTNLETTDKIKEASTRK